MKKATGTRLGLTVIAAFACLVAVYAVVFHVAHEAHIQDVPLAAKGGRP